MAQHRPALSEMRFLQEALSADYRPSNIRLREGEYQYTLAKAIASFQLELRFPDVKDIIKGLYGEEKASDIQFIRKIQTILKKMEKSNIVQILPKKKPWDLQRYALSSFKFQDIDKNRIVLATDQQIENAQDMLRSLLVQQGVSVAKLTGTKIKISILTLIVGASYAVSAWTLMQPIIDPIIFVPSFSIAAVCSLMLGKILS